MMRLSLASISGLDAKLTAGPGHAHRVEPRVGLVEQHDLGFHDQGPGQAGPLLHAPETSPGAFFR